jgi:hypothetical protein
LILNQSIKQSSTRLSRVSRIDTAATQQRWQQSSVGSSHVTYLTCRTRLLTEGDSAAQAICHVSKFMENRLGHASAAPRFRQVLVYCNILNLLLILSDNQCVFWYRLINLLVDNNNILLVAVVLRRSIPKIDVLFGIGLLSGPTPTL